MPSLSDEVGARPDEGVADAASLGSGDETLLGAMVSTPARGLKALLASEGMTAMRSAVLEMG